MRLLNTHLFKVMIETNYIAAKAYANLIKLCQLNGRLIKCREAMVAIKINFGTNWSAPSHISWDCLGGQYEITHRANGKKAKSRKRS